MTKLIAFAALVVAFLAVASATRFTITTVVEESDQQGQGQQGQGQQHFPQRCVQEVAPQSIRLRACQQWLLTPFERQEMRGQGQQQGQQGQQQGEQTPLQQQLLHECCEAFQNINDEQCRCAAVSSVLYDIGQMMEAQQEQRESTKQQEFQQIRQRAVNLPQMCNVGPQQCQV